MKLLNTLCCNFTKFASGPPIGIESTIEQETTFSASVDVGNSTTIKNGEQKKNTDTLPQAVLDLGFDPKQIVSAMALLPDELKQDPQRIIECIVNMGTSFEEVQYMTAQDAYKMVILVRTDLKMGVGKIAAQCCHAAVGACRGNTFSNWVQQGEAKIVLKVKNLNELKNYCQLARKEGLPVFEVQDAGRTEVAPGTETVAAIGPAKVQLIDRITGKLSLLK